MKQIALILTLLLAAAGASAQEVFIGADFDTRFDNREHSDCNIDDSHTFFSMRLTPKAGVIWSEKNRLVVAVDLLQDFGDKEHKFLSKVDPQIYYQFNSKTSWAPEAGTGRSRYFPALPAAGPIRSVLPGQCLLVL